jgi:hypothetical protein
MKNLKHRSKNKKPGKGNPQVVSTNIKFSALVLNKIWDRLAAERLSLRELHAHTLTGLINELGRQWADGVIRLTGMTAEKAQKTLDRAREK